MPKFSVQTQIDVIMAAFALHNYVRGNSEEETNYDLAEEDPDCIPADDEPRDVRGSDTSNANLYEGSNNMKCARNEIATLIWNARHR